MTVSFPSPGFCSFRLNLRIAARAPGGGITGILPVSGTGAFMAGSTSGGQMTPPPWSSFSLSVLDESPGAEHGFWSVLGACAKAGQADASTRANTNPRHASTAMTG